jgi:oligopeptide transport system permease protein
MKTLNQEVTHIIGQTFSASLEARDHVAIILAVIIGGIALGMLAAALPPQASWIVPPW